MMPETAPSLDLQRDPSASDDGADASGEARRPASRDPGGKREAIVDAAERIVSEEGLSALKARRLATEAKVALGTPVNLFGSIENVVVAVNARTFDRLADALDAVPRHADPRDDLVALGTAYAAFVERSPRLWGAVFEGRVDPPGQNPNEERVAGLLARLDERVTASLGTDRKSEARVLWGAVHGLVSLSVTGRTALLGLPELSDAVTALITRYLEGSSSPARTKG